MDAAIDKLCNWYCTILMVKICVLNNLWFAGPAVMIRRGGYIQ